MADVIGVGRTAEVLTHGDGQVVKLLLPGFGAGVLEAEARRTQAAHDAGMAAPATHGPITIDGRPGFVFDRVDGPMMLEDIERRPWRFRRHAATLAAVHADMHGRSTNGVPDVRDLLAAKIEDSPLDATHRRAAADRLASLGAGDRLLHGDFHPGNVILASDGPVVIDWLDAGRGDPAADVARALWLQSGPVIPPDTERRRVIVGLVSMFRRRYLARYRGLTGIDPGRVLAWRLPVLVARSNEGIDYEMEPLAREVARLVAG